MLRAYEMLPRAVPCIKLLARLQIVILISVTAAHCQKIPDPLLFARVINKSIKDITGKNADPYVAPSVTYMTGPFGEDSGAFQLSGAGGSYIEWSNAQRTLSFTDEYTIVMWVRNSGASIGCLYCYATSSSVGWEIWEYNADQMLYVRHAYGATINVELMQAGVLVSNSWVLLAVTYQKQTGKFFIYKNGVDIYRSTLVIGSSYATDFPIVRMGQRHSTDPGFTGAFSCIQVYNTYMNYRQISQVSQLCNPESAALSPWPEALGIWPVDFQFGTKDLSGKIHDITAFSTYMDNGPYWDDGSIVLAGTSDSYLEIMNSDKSISPVNSFTFSIWVYPTHGTLNGPLFIYEYGTELAGTNNWALHIWAFDCFFIRFSGSVSSLCMGSIKPFQWNFLAFSYDYSSDTALFLVNEQRFTTAFNLVKPTLLTTLANRIRIGKAYWAGETRYLKSRVACVQMYDVFMSLDEMVNLRRTCGRIRDTERGAPADLVYMFPFNGQSQCVGRNQARQTYASGGIDCQLTKGPRQRSLEAVRVTSLNMQGEKVFLHQPNVNSFSFSNSSFTIMTYIKVDRNTPVSASLGFTLPNGTSTDTWLRLSSNGTLQVKAGRRTEQSINDFYNQTENDWIHLAISCNQMTSRCYAFRNGSFVDEVVGDIRQDWLISDVLYIEVNSQLQGDGIELSCLQLYARALSQLEIVSAQDRCTLNGEKSIPPLPVAFWPLDTYYRTKELTRRSPDIQLSDGVTFLSDGPSRGSVHFEPGQFGFVPASSGTDIRFSFSFQAHLKVWQNSSKNPFPIFSYTDQSAGSGMSFQIVWTAGGIPQFQAAPYDTSGAEICPGSSSAGDDLQLDKWQLLSVTYDFSTGILTKYIDGTVKRTFSCKRREINTKAALRVGVSETHTAGASFSLSCVQLYNKALTQRQIQYAADICTDNQKYGVIFERPAVLPEGYTRSTFNSSTVMRNQMQCMAACMNSADCTSVSYNSTTRICSTSSLALTDTELATYYFNNDVYMERQHLLMKTTL